MKEHRVLLGIDIGTTHIKAGSFGLDGTARRLASRPNRTRDDGAGGSVFDPEELWGAVVEVIAEALSAAAPFAAGDVLAVGVASMAETGLLIDRRSLEPRTPLIPWFDARAAGYVSALHGDDPHSRRQGFLRSGLWASGKCSLVKLLWLLDRRPGIARGAVWLSAADYVVFKLTGALATDYSLAGRTYAFDIARKEWDGPWLERFGLDVENFPQARPGGTPAGVVSRAAAERCGLRAGTPVAVCGHDHVCASFAIEGLAWPAYRQPEGGGQGQTSAAHSQYNSGGQQSQSEGQQDQSGSQQDRSGSEQDQIESQYSQARDPQAEPGSPNRQYNFSSQQDRLGGRHSQARDPQAEPGSPNPPSPASPSESPSIRSPSPHTDHTAQSEPQLPAGAFLPERVFDSMGTAESLLGVLPPKAGGPPLGEAEFRSGLSYGCHLAPGLYYWMGGLSASGGSVEWLRGVLNEPALSYEEFERLVARAGEGPTGILYFPYLAGSSSPHTDPAVRAAWVGLSLEHGPQHLAKAALEGTAFEMEYVRREAGHTADVAICHVLATGGGTRSPAWMQIKADVSGCRIETPAVPEATLLGAALAAGYGCGVFSGLAEAFAGLARPETRAYEPDPARHAAYRRLFEQGYLPLQEPLRAYFRSLGVES